MHHSDILAYYSREDVQKAIVRLAANREVAQTTRDGTYMKRPDILLYPADVLERVKKGAVAFHFSVERCSNPLALTASSMESLRIGWDLIIDIDAKVKLEHARVAASVVVDFLKDYGINPTIKFSGRRGFHIGIAAEAFPKEIDFRPIEKNYPKAPQAILRFIKKMCAEQILQALIDYEGGLAALSKTLPSLEELSPYQFLEIETEWGVRHLFRAPYSLHEKSWLVSVPIRLYKLKNFEPSQAEVRKVKTSLNFLVNKYGEANELLIAALDWSAKLIKEKPPEPKRTKVKVAVPQIYFPPCIRCISEGLSDGRKRSIFTLAAFLHSINWTSEDIEKFILDTNKKNKPPLRERLIRTQLKWHERQKEMLPANCGSELFYTSIGICKPDKICSKIKNPVNYAMKAYIKRSKGKIARRRADGALNKLRKHKGCAQSGKG